MEKDSDFGSERAKSMARLATLQRLRDEMLKNNRMAMLKTIEEMMGAEFEAMRRADEGEARGTRDASNDDGSRSRQA